MVSFFKNLPFSYLFCALAMTLPGYGGDLADRKDEAAFEYCFILQASMTCDGIYVNDGAKLSVFEFVGSDFTAPGNNHTEACLIGLDQAFDNNGPELCLAAFERFGCSGDSGRQYLSSNGSGIVPESRCFFETQH
jgi:hypothetical protein